MSEIDCLEANYYLLKDLKKALQDNSEDESVQYTAKLVQEIFQPLEKSDASLSLEDIIKDHETLLAQKYEEEIRCEQEKRSQKVASGYYDAEEKLDKKSKKSKGKKDKKNKNEKNFSKVGATQVDIMKKVKERLSELEDGKKYITYQNYLKLINVVIQAFRLTGVDVKGYLNGSSHGSLVIGESMTVPHMRPHNGAMIPRTRAIAFCREILNQYFFVHSSKTKESTP